MIKIFQKYLLNEIPLTKDMGLEITQFSDEQLELIAPLANNVNDKGSVFGGSSSALMIIAAWSLIKLNCQTHEVEADIVIHKNQTLWNKPLYDDLCIVAKFNESYDFKQVKKQIEQAKHQRIECLIELLDDERNIYSTMVANYVIIPTSNDSEG